MSLCLTSWLLVMMMIDTSLYKSGHAFLLPIYIDGPLQKGPRWVSTPVITLALTRDDFPLFFLPTLITLELLSSGVRFPVVYSRIFPIPHTRKALSFIAERSSCWKNIFFRLFLFFFVLMYNFYLWLYLNYYYLMIYCLFFYLFYLLN